MSSRRNEILAAIAVAVTAGALGWVAGRTSAAVGAHPDPAVRLHGDRPLAPSGVDCVPLERSLDDLRAETLLTRRQLEDYRAEVVGVPVPVSGHPAARRDVETFLDVIDSIETSCPEVGLVTTDCAELPCIAAFRAGSDDFSSVTTTGTLFGCSTWMEAYAGYRQITFSVRCGGEPIHAMLLAPPTSSSIDPVEAENLETRLRARSQAIQQDWPCPDPAAGG